MMYERFAGGQEPTREVALESVRHYNLLNGRSMLPPEAISNAVLWLVSDEAAHVTGVALPVDAGHTILPGYNPNPTR
jgi:NAD(P)-dependent dehydrogenase (short-subunit alcohol dehydrogenase family)